MTSRATPDAGPHGGDGARLARALGIPATEVLDLSASLNPAAPDVGSIVARHLDEIGRYPDPEPATEAMAEALGVDVDRVLLTNGGAEAITLVAELLNGHVDEPEFALHPRGEGGPRWRSNPHNPTGLLAGPDDRADVWDEAFYAMATGSWTRGDEGAVVVGSLTKLFACPGLRLGYVLADPYLIAAAQARQAQWSVNGLAAGALPDLLALADLPGWAARIVTLRADLAALATEHGLDPLASDAPWVLCSSADGLRDRLAPEAVLVRDCASFGMPGVARIAVTDEPGLTRLATALERTAP